MVLTRSTAWRRLEPCNLVGSTGVQYNCTTHLIQFMLESVLQLPSGIRAIQRKMHGRCGAGELYSWMFKLLTLPAFLHFSALL